MPDFFPIPASVVFSHYVGIGQGDPLAPGTVQMWCGNCAERLRQHHKERAKRSTTTTGKYKSPIRRIVQPTDATIV